MIVVDASVALKWYLDEQGSEIAIDLMLEPLCAPGLFLLETANGLWKSWRKGVLDKSTVTRNIALLPTVIDKLYDDNALLEAALAISLDIDHPVYDCVYLALSRREGYPLITADRRLITRCSQSSSVENMMALEDWQVCS